MSSNYGNLHDPITNELSIFMLRYHLCFFCEMSVLIFHPFFLFFFFMDWNSLYILDTDPAWVKIAIIFCQFVIGIFTLFDK